MIEFEKPEFTDWNSTEAEEEKFYLAFFTITAIGGKMRTVLDSRRVSPFRMRRVLLLSYSQFHWCVRDLSVNAPDVALVIIELLQKYTEDRKTRIECEDAGQHVGSTSAYGRKESEKRSADDGISPPPKYSKVDIQKRPTAFHDRAARAVSEPQTPESLQVIPRGARGRSEVAASTDPVAVSVCKESHPRDVSSRRSVEHCDSASTHGTNAQDTSPSPVSVNSLESFTADAEFPGSSYIATVFESISNVHQLHRYADGSPREVHARILHSLRNDHAQAKNIFSDGSTWKEILSRGESASCQGQIFRLLELLGAWRWYQTQREHARMVRTTKKGGKVGSRGAATYARKACMAGIGNLDALDREAARRIRWRVRAQLQRGEKLESLTSALERGVLFSRDIWSYLKLKKSELDRLVAGIAECPPLVALFRILTPQLDTLVHTGRTDFPSFLSDLEKERLLSREQIDTVRKQYPVDAVSGDVLNAAVDRLLEEMKRRVLCADQIAPDDHVLVDGDVSIRCSDFHQLRHGEWFGSMMIMAAMQISDKPSFVRWSYAIDLDSNQGNAPRPFQNWKQQIMARRRETMDESLVHFRPLHRGQHFSLLEINEKSRSICHYDSMGTEDTVKNLVEEEFGDVGYAYREAETPRQRDGWSCGPRVVWNFRHIANGLPLGNSDDPCRMKLDIVEGFAACIENGYMRKADPRAFTTQPVEHVEEDGVVMIL